MTAGPSSRCSCATRRVVAGVSGPRCASRPRPAARSAARSAPPASWASGVTWTRAEIVDQARFWRRHMAADGQRITNIVFMGMGEPLLNADAVLAAADALSDPERFGLGARHITISTSGVVPGIDRLIGAAAAVHARGLAPCRAPGAAGAAGAPGAALAGDPGGRGRDGIRGRDRPPHHLRDGHDRGHQRHPRRRPRGRASCSGAGSPTSTSSP